MFTRRRKRKCFILRPWKFRPARNAPNCLLTIVRKYSLCVPLNLAFIILMLVRTLSNASLPVEGVKRPLLSVTATPADARNPTPPLSVEAALRDVHVNWYDRPVLSPDGRLLAYVTTSGPPDQSLTSQFGRQTHYLPNGMISSFFGSRLFVMNVVSGATVEMNAGKGSNWNATFSPDGRKIAFFSDAGGTPQLWVADVATGKARQVSDARIYVKMWTSLDRPTWTRDGSAAFVLTVRDTAAATHPPAAGRGRAGVTVRVQASGAEVGPTSRQTKTTAPFASADPDGGRVMRSAVEKIDIATGQRHTIVAVPAGRQPRAFAVAPSQKWVAYVSMNSERDVVHELSVAPMSGGTPRSLGMVSEIVYDGPASSEVFGATFHWSPTSDRLVFVQESALWLLDLTDVDGTEPQRLAPELGKISAPPGAASGRFDQPALTADGKTVIARLAANDTIAFAVIPLEGGPARRIISSRALRFRGLVYSTRDVLWQPNPTDLVFIGSDLVTGMMAVVRKDFNTGKQASIIEERSDIRFVASAGPESIIGEFTDANTPPDLFLFDATLKERRRLMRLNPALDELVVGESVTFAMRLPSYDGSMRTLKTSVLLPVGYKQGDRPPAIVRIYPDNEMSKRVNKFGAGRLAGAELAQLWTTRGYAVVLSDLTPVTPQLEGGGNLIREIRDFLIPQLYHAAELGYVDIERLVLTGHSYGGYGTTAMLTETSLFRAAIAYSSAPLDLFSTDWTEWPGRVARIRMGADPWSDFKQYLTNSPYHQADKIRTPLLLIHGTEDNVTSAVSEQMFRGLEQLGKTAQLAIYEGEPHYIGWWSKANAINAMERVLEFVARYVPVGEKKAGEGTR